MLWLVLYFGSMLVFPPLVFGVLILHLYSMGEKRKSKRDQKNIELAIRKALDK